MEIRPRLGHVLAMDVQPIGTHLRRWRERRRMSQLDLASEAGVSTRHLSFLETGRSAPSREMILRLADQLAVPVRERNVLLVAGGYAPVFPERRLDDASLAPSRAAIDQLLEAQKPYRPSPSIADGTSSPRTERSPSFTTAWRARS
jgi:transcriptional regulator with XRE-family HTH domain